MPSSARALVYQGRQELGNRSVPSRSQDSVSNRPYPPSCAKCGKDHFRECYMGSGAVLVVASWATYLETARMPDNGVVMPVPRVRLLVPRLLQPIPFLLRVLYLVLLSVNARIISILYPLIRSRRTLPMLSLVCSVFSILMSMC